MISSIFFITGISIVALLGIVSFIGFLGTIFSSIYTQHFPTNENGVKKAVEWNARFGFIKNVFWQWTIYVFSLVCFISLVITVLVQ